MFGSGLDFRLGLGLGLVNIQIPPAPLTVTDNTKYQSNSVLVLFNQQNSLYSILHSTIARICILF